MRFWANKKFVAVGAAVVLLSGSAGAFAATQLASPRQAYINDVASRLHVTPTALTSAMKQAMIDQVNAAQKAGKLTAAQADAAKSRIESRHAVGGLGGLGGRGFASGAWRPLQGRFACGGSSSTTSTTATPCKGGPFGGFGGHFGRFRFACEARSTTTTTSTSATSTTTSTTVKPCPGGPGFRSGRAFRIGGRFMMGGGSRIGGGFNRGVFGFGGSAVTTYLGISAATLQSDLAGGKSLAQIASAIPGKSVSGLESALTAAEKTRLDKAVSAGWMTSANEAKALSALSSQLSKLVNRSFKLPAAGRFHSFWKP